MTLPGDFLDYYLSLGYYRMNQDLFTCRFLPHDEQLYTTHWLRLLLPQVQYGPKQRQLLRLNARFTTIVRPFRFTAEYEALYARYYAALEFDTASSLEDLLLDGEPTTIFDTHVVEVRDGSQLIAAGIFDRGSTTLMGIVNFYDPAYRKYSLGKYLMLCKVEYAYRQQLAYYYPGYLVQDYPKFDYKLFGCPAATQVYDCLEKQWRPFSWEEVARQSAALWAERRAGEE